jgi:hypothetical protein
MRPKFVIALMLGLASAGCQKQSASTIQSVDNFAAAESRRIRNRCSGDYPVVVPEAELDRYVLVPSGDRTLMGAAKRALTAVPTVLQEIYFGNGATIEITPQARALCSSPEAVSHQRFAGFKPTEVEACWTRDDAKGFRIVLDAKAEVVEHQIPRLMSYFITDVMMLADWNPAADERSNPIYLPVSSPAGRHFLVGKINLALNYLEDVAVTKNERFSLAAFQGLVADDILAARGEQRAKLFKPNVQNVTFANYVFAETFDSLLCSDSTRERLGDFPQARALGTTLLREIQLIDTLMQHSASTLSEKQKAWQAKVDAGEIKGHFANLLRLAYFTGPDYQRARGFGLGEWSEGWGQVTSGFGRMWGAAKSTAGGWVSSARDGVYGAASAAGNAVANTAGAVRDAAYDGYTAARDTGYNVYNGVSNVVSSAYADSGLQARVDAARGAAYDAAAAVGSAAYDTVNAVGGAAGEAAYNGYAAVRDTGASLYEGALAGSAAVGDYVGTKYQEGVIAGQEAASVSYVGGAVQ